VLLSELLPQQQQPPPCQTCHAEEYQAWQSTTHAKAAVDPAFQAELQKSHDQGTCLKCHTTGFDSGSGKFLAQGVTCEACHGAYKEGHPAKETMQLPMASDTCRVCHQGTFDEWENSSHKEKGIECFDCHMAHTQGLRTGSEEKLCAACHADRQTQLSHATHGINGVDCASCHMSGETVAAAVGAQAPARSHSFKVASDACAKCHEQSIHAGDQLPKLRTTVAELDTNQLQAKAELVPALQAEVNTQNARINSLRNVAVAGMGAAFGLGGFAGLLVGLVGMAFWQKRRTS
jgi:hypothetical protein